MAATAATICHDLNKINTEDVDLYELEDQTREIVANLETIKESGKAL
jgi:hypothetical protein